MKFPFQLSCISAILVFATPDYHTIPREGIQHIALKKTVTTVAELAYQTGSCSRTIELGSRRICVPLVAGMNECYRLPNVKEYVDSYEYEKNEVLAFYANDNLYREIHSIESSEFDDYAKAYIPREMINVSATPSIVTQLGEMIQANYISETWSSLKPKMEKHLTEIGASSRMEQPVLIESYTNGGVSNSHVVLMPIHDGTEKKVLVAIMSSALIQDRIIMIAYYKRYSGSNSISDSKAKSNLILSRFQNVN